MEAETRSFARRPRRPLPAEANGRARAPQMRRTNPAGARGSLQAGLTGAAVDQARAEVGRRQAVMIRSWTATATATLSTFLDFNFRPPPPEWLDDVGEGPPHGAQQAFEGLIVAFFTLAGNAEDTNGRGHYARRNDYHTLEEEKELPAYFFRHCGAARLCVELQGADGGGSLL